MQDFPQTPPTALLPRPPETPLWRVPEAEAALAEASDTWGADGAAAALPALRRANRCLQQAGHLGWYRRGEHLLADVAEIAHGDAGVATGAVRNALREFERQIWRLGIPINQGDVLDSGDASVDPAMIAGWPVAAARSFVLPPEALPLRQQFERHLLEVLRGPDAGVGVGMSHMAAAARDIHGLSGHPYDLWRLAAACLHSLSATPAGLPEKRLCARLNLQLGHQLKPTAVAADAEQGLANEILILLAHHVADMPDRSSDCLDTLTDFGLLDCMILPPAFEVSDDAADHGRDWQTVGPLAVRQAAWQTFLDRADDWLPALPTLEASLALARGARQIGLAPVAWLAAALASVTDSAQRHGIDAPTCPQAVDALRGMLHRFAAQTYPEMRGDLVAELAQVRETMLQRHRA